MREAPVHGAIVLAAGASGRLGRSKQLMRFQGETLVRRATRLALGTQPRDAIVVVGAEADAVHASVADLPVRRIDCADWRDGMGASLRAGLDALSSACDGALVVLCDQPALDVAHLDRLCSAWREQPHRAIASAYAGRLGVPALLPRSWFKEIHGNDRGARDLLASRMAEVVAVEHEALAWDIDTESDLDAAFDQQ
jgi:CTP:molybdopterin cytidylyltransferase MocA